MFFFSRINIVLQVLLSVSLHRPQIIYHAHGINVCTPKYDTLISTKYILSKTTAAASSSPLLSGRTKSASGPDHPHFATVRVISSSVASLSLSAESLLLNSNRKNSTAVQSSESKSEKKYFEVLRVLRIYFLPQYKSEK